MLNVGGNIRKLAKAALLRGGYEIHRYNPDLMGRDPYRDMLRLLGSKEQPVVFDVGSNIGQTVLELRTHFTDPAIHSFEPSPSTFDRLKQRTLGIPNLHLNNVAMGATAGRRVLIESAISQMSSILEPSTECWGEVVANTAVDVETLDHYCSQNKITEIDVLKIDTQGFDYAVLQGGAEMLKNRRVRLLYIELIFSDMYRGQGSFEEIYAYATERGFRLVSIYDQNYQNDHLGWADGLFAAMPSSSPC